MKILSFMVILAAMVSMAYFYNVDNIPAMVWTGLTFITATHLFVKA